MFDFTNSFIQNKNKFKAGKATLNQQEIIPLLDETIELIHESFTEFEKSFNYGIISEINLLFDSILESELEKDFLTN